MSGFKVEWDRGEVALQTEKAARILVGSFREEGRTATAYHLVDGEWTVIAQ
jgi:hypothetical protein